MQSMNNLEEHREIFYQNCAGAQRFLYNSPQAGKQLFTIATKYQITDDNQYYKFALTVGDIILGFYKIEDTVPLLQQELGVDPKTAALLGAEVLEFLAPLNDPNWQPPVESIAEVNIEEETLPAASTFSIPVKTNSSSAPQPVSAYHQPTAPQPLHTLASDMAAVKQGQAPSYQATPVAPEAPTYSSSQNDLRSPLSGVPSYQPTPEAVKTPAPAPEAPDRPRWSSDY